MDAELFLALSIGGFDIFVSKYSSKADSDNLFVATHLFNSRVVYVDFECGDGRADDSTNPGRYDEFLGRNWQLSSDFSDKLPCQYRDA